MGIQEAGKRPNFEALTDPGYEGFQTWLINALATSQVGRGVSTECVANLRWA